MTKVNEDAVIFTDNVNKFPKFRNNWNKGRIQMGRIKSYVREHASEMVIVGIMFGISVSIAMLATGDITEAIARKRHQQQE